MIAKESAQAITLGYYKRPLPGRAVISTLPDGFGFVTESDNGLHIDIPGTKDFKDICTDLVHDWIVFDKGAVHEGFYNQFVVIRDFIHDSIWSFLFKTNKPLFISGHSEGAAIAWLLAEELKAHSPTVYVFSCPGFADRKFCAYLNSLNIKTESLAGKYDLIPSFPLRAKTPIKPARVNLKGIKPFDFLGQHSIEHLEKAL